MTGIVIHKNDHARLRIIQSFDGVLLCEEVDSEPQWYVGLLKYQKPRRVCLSENVLPELPTNQLTLTL